MRTLDQSRVAFVEDGGALIVRGEYTGWLPPDALPDLSDPATIGCLLHLVQQAGGDVPAHPDAESLVAALEATND